MNTNNRIYAYLNFSITNHLCDLSDQPIIFPQMDKTIEPVNFNASQDLIIEVGEIFDKLTRFNDRIVKADIYMKALRENPPNNKKIEVRIFLPGKDVFVDQDAESFVGAAHLAYDRLKVLVTKEKEKHRTY